MPQAASKPAVVFLGPSLPVAEAATLLDAEYFPPARHGDIYRVLTSGARVIVLIDGVFHTTPSVWQREVLAALDEGITVVGGSSMGALRGAELAAFGMIGCGTIFEWYRDGVIDADDEVALLHAGLEAGYRGFSEPLVNIRATVAAARRAGHLSGAEAAALVGHVRTHHYSQRSYDTLWTTPCVEEMAAARRQALRDWVASHAVNLKAADARLALVRGREGFDRVVSPPAERRDRSVWDATRALSAGLWHGHDAVTVSAMVGQARKRPELWASRLAPEAANATEAINAELITRFFALTWADRGALRPTDAELEPLSRAFEARWAVQPTREHLAANGLTARTYAEELRARARYDWLLAQPGVAGGSALVLRWAAGLGVSLAGTEPAGLAAAIVARGPWFFGYDWNIDVAFARELQLTGLAAGIAATVA